MRLNSGRACGMRGKGSGTRGGSLVAPMGFRRARAACRASEVSSDDDAEIQAWLEGRMERSRQRLWLELDPPPKLQLFKVVLVAPKQAQNVGAVVRVCENFEAFHLEAVEPRCDVRGQEVWKVACGSAVVSNIQVHETLEAALSNVEYAVAFTRRQGSARPVAEDWDSLCETASGIAGILRTKAEVPGAGPRVALVFGREESGLTAEETAACSHLCAIPTGRTQPSMNLSHAVAVILAQIFARAGNELPLQKVEADVATVADSPVQSKASYKLEPASRGQLQALWSRLQRIAPHAGLRPEIYKSGGNHARRLTEMGHFKALLDRAGLTVAEVHALHTLFKAMETKVSDQDVQHRRGICCRSEAV
eukprot:TRINITY_DN3743_c0_g1_i1.p1 TRINITY_DN3743_c0_g1~~TRINITY_DN3743_c0_g1_i1.p1  ORF type:complete len:364 (+),score=35.60 TRINITY_DN3743_c0_g1_i1:326-1417(+)